MSPPRRPSLPFSAPPAPSQGDEPRAGRLMISPEPGTPGRARVIGSLTGNAVQLLLDAVDGGVAVFDLSEVDQIDDSAVRVLAGLSPGRCTLLACPRWLELWLARVGRDPGV
jgi:hypothetical protein